jgi:hypothetical protein
MKKLIFILICLAVLGSLSCGEKEVSFQAKEESSGLFLIVQSGKYGYIDRSGKYLINPQFDIAEDFHEGLAQVESGNKRGYIDKTGKYVWNPQD